MNIPALEKIYECIHCNVYVWMSYIRNMTVQESFEPVLIILLLITNDLVDC